jgi:hypothetical protein
MEDKSFVFSTAIIDEIVKKQQNGFILKRYENPWFNNEHGVRREGISFRITPDEQLEYTKCKMDIQYFANSYCKIKREDGSVGHMTLRDYQQDILDLYVNNRFSILCASRQIGKCMALSTTIVELKYFDEIYLMPLYKFLFKVKSKKTIIDYLKNFFYHIIFCASRQIGDMRA